MHSLGKDGSVALWRTIRGMTTRRRACVSWQWAAVRASWGRGSIAQHSDCTGGAPLQSPPHTLAHHCTFFAFARVCGPLAAALLPRPCSP